MLFAIYFYIVNCLVTSLTYKFIKFDTVTLQQNEKVFYNQLDESFFLDYLMVNITNPVKNGFLDHPPQDQGYVGSRGESAVRIYFEINKDYSIFCF